MDDHVILLALFFFRLLPFCVQLCEHQKRTRIITNIVFNQLKFASFLSFAVRPGAPHNLRFIQAAARSVVLNFTPGPSGRAPILTYTIEYNNDSFYDPFSARWKTVMIIRDAHLVWNLLPLTLPNLKPYTDYRFRVIAKNKVGSSSPSNASDTIKTLETGKRKFYHQKRQ